jgi:hypothetical protein
MLNLFKMVAKIDMMIPVKSGVKFPIEFQIKPTVVGKGGHHITLTLKNISKDKLTSLDIKLNSLDVYGLSVYGNGEHLTEIKPGKKEEISFRVLANRSARVYAIVSGYQNDTVLNWESPYIKIKSGDEVVELSNVFALTEPYPPPGKTIRFEAVVRGLSESEGLNLEFWVDTPSGMFKELAILETKKLKAGEVARHAAELTPSEEGLHTIHAYLYDNGRQIGHETDMVWVEKK